jgi:hypothetical protein
MSPPSLAYLAGGRLHVKLGEAPVRTFDSAFGQQMRDRHVEIQQKHSWKAEGRGARFMSGLLWGTPERDPQAMQVAITSLTRGPRPGELLYALSRGAARCACSRRTRGGGSCTARRSGSHDVRAARARADRLLGAAPDGTASIAVMALDATDLREVTEGDAQDRAPAWAPGPDARIVYQSASVGRDAAGRPAALGPSEVHLLDLRSGALETLAAEPDHDLVCPQLDAHGTLFYVRRPHRRRERSFFGALLDIVLIPARLLFAVFQYLNFFSARYTGKPLTTAGARQKRADVRQIMVWSNLMEAEQAGATSRRRGARAGSGADPCRPAAGDDRACSRSISPTTARSCIRRAAPSTISVPMAATSACSPESAWRRSSRSPDRRGAGPAQGVLIARIASSAAARVES